MTTIHEGKLSHTPADLQSHTTAAARLYRVKDSKYYYKTLVADRFAKIREGLFIAYHSAAGVRHVSPFAGLSSMSQEELHLGHDLVDDERHHEPSNWNPKQAKQVQTVLETGYVEASQDTIPDFPRLNASPRGSEHSPKETPLAESLAEDLHPCGADNSCRNSNDKGGETAKKRGTVCIMFLFACTLTLLL
jgi:hypothetical protein